MILTRLEDLQCFLQGDLEGKMGLNCNRNFQAVTVHSTG